MKSSNGNLRMNKNRPKIEAIRLVVPDLSKKL
jgi:hypothetical protein